MPRLFAAIPLPEVLGDVLDSLVEEHPGVTWVPPKNRHLTLQFLGQVPDDAVPEIAAALREVQIAPFLLPVQGVGRFPPRGAPRVLWAGVGKGHPHLFALQKRVADQLMPLGFDPGGQSYVPHITLARCKPRAAEFARQFRKKHANFTGPPFRVQTFTLYRSDPGNGNATPVYTPVLEQRLR
jgi:2'-5' RNA ligase